MKPYYILKPKNLNLESLVQKYSPDFKFNIDFAYLVVYFVIQYQCKKADANPVRLYSLYLKNLCPMYKKHIAFLIENFPNDGAVLRGTRYSKGKSYGYKLPKYYFDSEFELYAITDQVLLRRINTFLVKNTTNEQIRLHYYFLLKYFRNGKLSMYNPQLALEKANSIIDRENRLRNAKSIVRILNGEGKLTLKPQTVGRVYSSITQMSKITRNHLQYDGELLAEVDISSALPYFLFISMQYFMNNNFEYITSEFQYSNPFNYMLHKSSIALVKSGVDDFGDSVLQKKLYQRFADMIFNENLYTSNGKDYEKVMKYYKYAFKKQFGYPFDGDMEDLLKFSKKRLLSMFFAKSNKYLFEQLAFGTMFPEVLKFINHLKNFQSCDEEEHKDSDSHKRFSHFSFQFEAKTMIDKIAREYDKLHRGKVPVFTLHDCLITTVSHVYELKEFMEKKFIELFGVAPKLTLEKSIYAEDFQNVS